MKMRSRRALFNDGRHEAQPDFCSALEIGATIANQFVS